MRRTAWITILVGLFMFQSLWNVAAAFCAHEEVQPVQQRYHFGHHQSNLCVSDTHHQSEQKQPVISMADTEIAQDHQDHLPSMTHWILQQQKSYDVVVSLDHRIDPQFYWQNHYNSPDLFRATPPPQLSPLTVG